MQFYGTINSLYKALAEPLTAFVFPAAVYLWVYRSEAARDNAVLKPWKCVPGPANLLHLLPFTNLPNMLI